MKFYKFEDMVGGWFVGNFEPSALKTKFEVCYKKHKKGEDWPSHYHKRATEINLLIKGQMLINGILINKGDIFVIEPNEIAVPSFLENCKLIVIKTVSDPKDKYLV